MNSHNGELASFPGSMSGNDWNGGLHEAVDDARAAISGEDNQGSGFGKFLFSFSIELPIDCCNGEIILVSCRGRLGFEVGSFWIIEEDVENLVPQFPW